MSSNIVPAEKRFRVSLLLDTYGELLTEKQRTFLTRYYEEDLSFGEIARDFGVSRQAIFDSVKHGEASLEHYEKILGLVRKGGRAGAPAAADAGDAVGRLREIAAQARDLAAKGEPVDPEWVASAIDEVAEDLSGAGVVAAGSSTGTTARAEAEGAKGFLRGGGPDID